MLLLAACAAAWTATPVAAVTYKWLDENGRVVYGDTPPPGVKAERINTALPPADPNAARDLASQDAAIKKRQQDRADEEAKAEKDRADANLRRSQCQQALGQIRALREESNDYRIDEKGEKVLLDAAARESAIAQNQQIMRDIGCTPAVNAPASSSTTVNAPAGTSTTPTY
jgi:hypothetical protein